MEVIDDMRPHSGAAAAGIHPLLRQRIAREFEPRWRDAWGGRFILHGRVPDAGAVRLDGNDYLAVSGHPDIVRAQVEALRSDGEAVVQSGVFLLEGHPVHRLEREIARWMGHEDGVLCQSGYAANLGLLQIIADAQTPVYIDALAHMSLWEGARAASAPVHVFRHNDPAHLRRLLAAHGPGVIAVDSLYSTTGSLCPVEAIVAAAEAHGCMTVVDESHSLGTHGEQGAGICHALGLSSRVDFITVSLAKAFAGRGGFFTMPAPMRYYTLISAFPNIFSSSLLSHEVAGLAATLKVLKAADEERRRLHANTRRLRASLAALGYPIQHGTEQIIALESGSEASAMRLRDELECRDVVGSIFCAPATSRNRAMVRLTLNAALTEAELEHVEHAAKEVAAVVEPWKWPIARRMASTRAGTDRT